MFRPLVLGASLLPLAGSLLAAQGASPAKIAWQTRFAEAQKIAQRDWKLIVIDAGREA